MLMAQEQQAAQAMQAQMLAQMQGMDVNQAGMMANGLLQGRALDQDMSQFYTNGAIQQQLADAGFGVQSAGAQAGVDVANRAADIQTRNNLINAGATGLETLSQLGNSDGSNGGNKRSSQSAIDDAFNNG
jgi:hypothetical protein